MKRKLTSLCTFLLTISAVFAQQIPQYSQYNFNHYLLNPAVAGVSKYLEAQMGVRAQWLGFEGSPTTIFASVHLPLDYPIGNTHIKEKPHQGIGGYMFRDQTGPISNTGVYGSYSYHLKVSRESRLALGVSLGLKQYAIDGTRINFTQSDFDPKVSGKKESYLVPDGTIGAWYHTKHVFAGLSMNQIFTNRLDIEQPVSVEDFGKLDHHYSLNVGYIYDLNSYIKLVPSVLFKAVAPAPLQMDVSLKTVFDEQYWVGASMRNFDAFVVFAGFIHGNFEVGYAFDLTFNAIQKHSAGSHEIIVGLILPRFEHDVLCPARFW